MTGTSWELVLEPEPEGRNRKTVRWGLHLRSPGQWIPVVDACGTLQEFESRVQALQARFSEIVDEARQAWDSLPSGEESVPVESVQGQEPALLWERLVACPSHAALQDLFNDWPEDVRRSTAEYVFSAVGMFSGTGAFFAQRYNQENGRLEGLKNGQK